MLTLRDEAGVPLERPFKDAMPRLPWATTAFKRRKSGKWGTVAGWYGHGGGFRQKSWGNREMYINDADKNSIRFTQW